MAIKAEPPPPPSPPEPPAPPQQQAIGAIQDARNYVEAARVLYEQANDPLGVPRYFGPTYFLLAHSIELVLKAYLLSQGVEPRELTRRPLRHNLAALLERARALGFEPADDAFYEAVEWLSPYHEDHVFRYRRNGLMSLPHPRAVAKIVAATIAGVERTVRARYFATIAGVERTVRARYFAMKGETDPTLRP